MGLMNAERCIMNGQKEDGRLYFIIEEFTFPQLLYDVCYKQHGEIQHSLLLHAFLLLCFIIAVDIENKNLVKHATNSLSEKCADSNRKGK